MESIEITGKTLKDATIAAAAQLGVAPEALTVTLLEESKGLFGKAQVRIRAEVAEPVAAPAAAPEPAVVEEPAAKPRRVRAPSLRRLQS